MNGNPEVVGDLACVYLIPARIMPFAAILDAGLAHLSGMSELKSLFLYGTAVTEKGKNKLKQAIKHLKIRE